MKLKQRCSLKAGMCRWGGQGRGEGTWHLGGCSRYSKSPQPVEAALGVFGGSEQWDVH